MYQVGICDDDPVFLENTVSLVNKIMLSNGISCAVHICHGKSGLYRYMKTEMSDSVEKAVRLDLLFLDVFLEGDNGIQIAKRLRENGNDIPIIFTTVSRECLLEGYTAEPVGFLLKPLEPEKLSEALLRAYNRYKKRAMMIHTPIRTICFQLDEVLYLEIFNKELSVHMLDGSVQKAMTSLHSLVEKLTQDQFVQCHRSYIVSLSAVSSICRYSIYLKNGERIPVSKKRYKDVVNAIAQFSGEGMEIRQYMRAVGK